MALANEESSSDWVTECISVIRRHVVLILLFSLAGAAAGFMIFLKSPVLFRSRMTLEFQGFNESFMNLDSVDPQAGMGIYSNSVINIATQLHLLTSPSLADVVWEQIRSELKPVTPRPDRFQQPRRLLNGGEEANPERFTQEALKWAMATTGARILPGTRVIEVSCDSTSPEIAAVYLNALANHFLELTMRNRLKSIRATTEWLADQVEQARIKLDESEGRLQEFMQGRGLMFVSSADTLAETRLKQLQVDLANVQADRVAKQTKVEMISRTPPSPLPELVDDPVIRSAQIEISTLRGQLADLTTAFTSEHYRVQRLEARIKELESVIERQKALIIRRIEAEFEAARNKEQELQEAHATQGRIIAAQAEKGAELGRLKRDVELIRQTYNQLLQQSNQAKLASVVPTNNLRIVDPAAPPGAPYKPSIAVLTGWGLAGGMMFGFGLAYLMENRMSRLRSPAELNSLLHMRALGVIPSGDASRVSLTGLSRSVSPLALLPGSGGREDERLELVTWQNKPSVFAESFRMTMASIMVEHFSNLSSKAIVITSPGPGEGKTTVACNMAAALSETRRRVVLIDGDLRRPKLHSIFNLGSDWGLTDIIEDSVPIHSYPLEKLVVETKIPGVYLLPAGSVQTLPSATIYNRRTMELLARLRTEFDVLLLDTPPVLQFAEARVFGRLLDGVILVIRANRTESEQAVEARQLFVDDGTRVLGSILNDWTPAGRDMNRYYGYLYSRRRGRE